MKNPWEGKKNTKVIQLHSGVENVLSVAYKVDGIPCYILIDKAGNLIAADSPRPSDPKLKETIGNLDKEISLLFVT
ncbi:TlpA family protein disulfide reductase [Sphingobacterium sp. 1.A.4]|uniref:TlpA family protein disulfide reductase n=1 Tax=Sphingobacterium sp. 1.A.4 TaxID=2044603 RepID=UPI000C0BBCE6|nr:hypothetical protein [Sphingobacterium sp. 1.A.4]